MPIRPRSRRARQRCKSDSKPDAEPGEKAEAKPKDKTAASGADSKDGSKKGKGRQRKRNNLRLWKRTRMQSRKVSPERARDNSRRRLMPLSDLVGLLRTDLADTNAERFKDETLTRCILKSVFPVGRDL